MLLILVVVLLVFALGGGWGQSQFGPYAWSPLGLVLLIVVVMWLTGNLRLH
jgi:hypothetical protein